MVRKRKKKVAMRKNNVYTDNCSIGGDEMYQKPTNVTRLFKLYSNKWVALDDNDKVISYGNTLKVALSKANKKGYDDPTVMRIPDPHCSLAL